MEYVILTNNNSLEPDLPGFAVIHIRGGLEAVYRALCDRLQDGYELISCPLPANVPLIRSPVRSVILRKASRKYDARGLAVLEKARERTAALGVVDAIRTRPDFEDIDKDQLGRAIRQLAEFDARKRLEKMLQ